MIFIRLFLRYFRKKNYSRPREILGSPGPMVYKDLLFQDQDCLNQQEPGVTMKNLRLTLKVTAVILNCSTIACDFLQKDMALRSFPAFSVMILMTVVVVIIKFIVHLPCARPCSFFSFPHSLHHLVLLQASLIIIARSFRC